VGSGDAGVSIWVWKCVNAVNSSGNKVSKACCHIERIGLSGVMDGGEGVCAEVEDVVFCAEVKCELRFGG
jgi:hypothetical protein